MVTSDQIREAQRATWAKCSAGWDTWDTVINAQMRPVGDAMIRSLGIGPDQQHLDIASGPGEPGLSIAHLASAGRVVLTDLVPEMLEIAARRAETQGLTNVETTACSADDLPFPDATFDSISVRFGYMFFPDMARATSEFRRVLKPGGRVSASVWVDPDANPWTTIMMTAIATEIDLPVPAPTAPHIFRCAAPGYVSDLYRDAGLVDVSERDVRVELVTSSPQEYWAAVSEHVAPAVLALEKVDAAARDRIEAKVLADVRAYESAGAIRTPGAARCIVGTRQA